MAPEWLLQHDFTLADKVWLLDCSERNPGINATDLGVSAHQQHMQQRPGFNPSAKDIISQCMEKSSSQTEGAVADSQIRQ
jgi:hypothetical protein